MNWNRPKDTLHEELLEESRRNQRHVARYDVSGHECSAEATADQYDETAAKVGRQVSEKRASNDSSYLSYCGYDSRLSWSHASLVLQEGWVEVCGAVADAVEACQENDHVCQ